MPFQIGLYPKQIKSNEEIDYVLRKKISRYIKDSIMEDHLISNLIDKKKAI